MTDAPESSVSELPEESTALVEVKETENKRKKDKKKKKKKGGENPDLNGTVQEGGQEQVDSENVHKAFDNHEGGGDEENEDSAPKGLSVKQRKKKKQKNRIKRQKARLAKLRKREEAKKEEEKRRQEKIAYEQERLRRKQAWLERQQQQQVQPGQQMDFRLAPGTESVSTTQSGQNQQQKPEQTGAKVITSRSWNSLFTGKDAAQPAQPLFAKQGAQSGGFTFLGGASAFPDSLPSGLLLDGPRGDSRSREDRNAKKEGEEPKHEPEKKKRRVGLKGESLFADLETQFVALSSVISFLLYMITLLLNRTSRGCNNFVRPDEEKMKEVWSRTKQIVGKDSRNKARTQRKRRNMMTSGGAAAAAAVEKIVQSTEYGHGDDNDDDVE